MRQWHRMDVKGCRWLQVNSRGKDGYRCWEMDEQVQVSGGKGGGRVERCGEINGCRSVAAAMMNGGSEHKEVNGNGPGRLEEAEGERL